MASSIHFHTRDDVKQYLGEAFSIVDELELTDEFALKAFEKAVDLLAAQQVFFTDADAVKASPIALPRHNRTPMQ